MIFSQTSSDSRRAKPNAFAEAAVILRILVDTTLPNGDSMLDKSGSSIRWGRLEMYKFVVSYSGACNEVW